ncbi:MAG: TetR/AcrR family transcriptional regulator [Lentisphaerae bacterium]|nr:TetR/AcrR family transcriptional regulator [Lentisphaerota bacterium]
MAKGKKYEQILDALERLLPGKRFHEITLDEVAREARVGKGTIYLYFKDKDALFAEMVCYRMERLKQQLAQLENCTLETLPEKVFALVDDFIKKHRSGFGAGSAFASQVSRMTGEQYEQLKQAGAGVVDALAQVMQSAGWSRQEANERSQMLLWLIDGYARNVLNDAISVPPPEVMLAFFRRGCGMV